jgi:hypothetical protein
MKVTLKDIVLGLTIAIMAFIIFDGCESRKKIVRQNIELLDQVDSVSFYKSKSDELIASNEALVITSVNQIEGLEKELNDLKLKKPRTVIKVNTVAEIKEVEVLIDVPCEDFNLPFEVDSSYYHIKGLLTNKALKFNSVTIPNEQAIYVADLRKKWWKKKEYSVVVTNTNPYIESVGLTSYTIEPDKEFYKKKWFWTVVGFVGGVYIGSRVN